MMDQVLCASEDNRECYLKIGSPACTLVLDCIGRDAEAVQQRTLLFLTHMCQVRCNTDESSWLCADIVVMVLSSINCSKVCYSRVASSRR